MSESGIRTREPYEQWHMFVDVSLWRGLASELLRWWWLHFFSACHVSHNEILSKITQLCSQTAQTVSFEWICSTPKIVEPNIHTYRQTWRNCGCWLANGVNNCSTYWTNLHFYHFSCTHSQCVQTNFARDSWVWEKRSHTSARGDIAYLPPHNHSNVRVPKQFS